MKFNITKFLVLVVSCLTFAWTTESACGDTILSSGSVSVSQPSGGNFLAGTAVLNITGADIPNIELVADLDVIDAGVNVVVNGTSLFPLFEDVSQFGPSSVFTGTGEPSGGGINNPFGPNNNGLPRLTVSANSAGTTFSGATFAGDSTVTPFTPVFTTENITDLLVAGDNTIDFFVLNNFQAAQLQGNFTVTLAAVPEPASGIVVTVLAVTALMCRRRRSGR